MMVSTGRHVLRVQEPELAEAHRGNAVVQGEILGQREAQAHDHPSFHLALEGKRIDHQARVMRGNDGF